MNVLEKILEEIEEMRDIMESTVAMDCFGKDCEHDDCTVCVCERAMEIIRSHMNDIPDRNVGNRRLIDANALGEEVRNFFMAITGNPKQGTIVRECKESFRRMIDEQPTVYVDDGWIPVEERLPEEGTYVMCCFDDGAVDALWQNWQEDKSLLFYADINNEIRKAIAWQPLPKPYKPKKDISTAGTEHIMSRFTRIE